MNQIELHKKIDILLSKGPGEIGTEEISALVSVNEDAHQYFFTQADEQWLDWLWGNGFLDAIKEKSEDPTRFGGQRFPELNYFVKVAEKEPSKVVDIMLVVPVSVENFNPGVIDRFIWICSILPADQLARMVPKIKKENWVKMMGAFNSWGFEYEKMFTTLKEAQDYDSIITLARAILVVRPKDVVKKEGFASVSTENPFYFNDLSYTKAFEHLANIDIEYAEQALALVIKTMADVVNLGDKADSGEVFPIQETFHLYDVDFFSLELGDKEHLSHRDDVRQLAAVIKDLAKKTIGMYDTDPFKAKDLYEKYFKLLPDSRSMWRLRLYVMSLYPNYFKDELKNTFFRLFEVERYHEIISGAEYEKALKKGFYILSDIDQREYVKKIIEYFKKKDDERKNDKENWHLGYGSRILTVIKDHLTEEEQRRVEEKGFKFISDYKPEPSIRSMRAGTVRPKGPIKQEEFGRLSVVEIAKKLRDEWIPEKLSKQNKSDDFLNPLNAEGVGELLRIDIPRRLQNYVNNANLFFKRDVLDQHYTYSFLRGIQELLRGNKTDTSGIDWDNLITLCLAIKESGESKPFEREKRERDRFDAWLSGWDAVHSAMTDVIQELLREDKGKSIIDFPKHRNQLFSIISYLLTYPDPIPADEEPETAGMKTKSPGSDEYLVSDPYSMAINTVRGRAFQAFVMFVYQDGKRLNEDIKELYKEVLKKESTRAIMFMFGHYIPSFYFRDIEWIRGLLPQIFPIELEKKHLYLAAWEGYLVSNLYKEIFIDPDFQKLYKRGLTLTDTEDLKQKHFKDPDEGIATHLALAFMHYEDFGFDHSLFKTFWKKNDPKQHADFVSFLGRMFVSGSNANADELLKKEPRVKQRLKDLWDYLLKNYKDPRPFIEMGFWISLEKDIFEVQWLAEYVKKTLEKTKGSLDWDYGLMKTISQLAEDAPKDTLEIARLYLLEGGVRGTNKRIPLHVDNEWREALEILYNNSVTKSDTYALIDELIREGGSAFWKLKEILNK